MLRKAIYIIITFLLLGGAILLASFAGLENRKSVCRSFSLKVVNPQDEPLITEEELLDNLKKRFGHVEGKNLDKVPVFEIEQYLNTVPYLQNTNVFSTLNGDIVATVQAREPVIRIITKFDEGCLIDTCGVMMPLNPRHPVRVLVASGNINVKLDTISGHISDMAEGAVIRNIQRIAMLINQDEFLDALIGQIYLNELNEVELIPKIGNQSILLGDFENMAKKLMNLKAFYLQIMKHTGWEKYSIINLTYDNQVVCSK
jgi:cell division protein FtsQ